MATRPKLTENQIKELANAQSFQRGQAYYNNGAIANPTQQDNRIWADCYGSQLYHVSATITKSQVSDIRCSCPYDWGGICKHEVALLLTYVHEPNAFHVIPPLRELLKNHSRDDLFNLLDRLLQQQPDLITNLEVAAEVSAPQKTGKPIDTTAYRRQVDRALQGDEMEDIANKLKAALATAEQLYAAGDALNAGQFYAVLLDEITDSYDDDLRDIDYDGEVAGYSQDAVAGLGKCFAVDDLDPNARQAWLHILLNGVFREIALGGIDFAAGAMDIIVDCATDDEWMELEDRIRLQIKNHDRWGRDALAEMISSRLAHVGLDEAADDVMFELGSAEQQTFILLRQGKFDLAIGMAKQHFPGLPGLAIQFADSLIAAGQPEKALRYMAELAGSRNYYGYNDWLANYHREQGDPKIALALQEEIFFQRPWLETYKSLAKLATQVGGWKQIRARVLKQLEAEEKWALLLEIAIDEQDVDRALKLLPKLSYHGEYKLQVAQLVREKKPDRAIALYEELADAAIARRGRDFYQQAVRYLQEIQKLKKLKQNSAEWQSYLQQIRNKYPTLRALHEEMQKL